jgi:hypothetical protein
MAMLISGFGGHWYHSLGDFKRCEHFQGLKPAQWFTGPGAESSDSATGYLSRYQAFPGQDVHRQSAEFRRLSGHFTPAGLRQSHAFIPASNFAEYLFQTHSLAVCTMYARRVQIRSSPPLSSVCVYIRCHSANTTINHHRPHRIVHTEYITSENIQPVCQHNTDPASGYMDRVAELHDYMTAYTTVTTPNPSQRMLEPTWTPTSNTLET